MKLLTKAIEKKLEKFPLFEREYGYFSLSELESVRLPFGMGIERDMSYTNRKVGDIKTY